MDESRYFRCTTCAFHLEAIGPVNEGDLACNGPNPECNGDPLVEVDAPIAVEPEPEEAPVDDTDALDEPEPA
jgi:hypothetical protein